MTEPRIVRAPSKQLTESEVAKILGISRSMFYLIPFFRARASYVRPRSPRWSPSDVELYLSLSKREAA